MGLLRRHKREQPAEESLPPAASELEPDLLFGDDLLTAATLEASPVAPGLFESLVTYGDRVARGDESLGRRLRSNHPLVHFGETFWSDMAASVYLWRAEDLPRRDTALKLYFARDARHRRRGDRPAMSTELAALMRDLAEYVYLTRDELYDSGLQDVHDHQVGELAENVLNTCEHTAAWAATVGLDDLQTSAAAAADAVRYL